MSFYDIMIYQNNSPLDFIAPGARVEFGSQPEAGAVDVQGQTQTQANRRA
jgi:hypothetical protein